MAACACTTHVPARLQETITRAGGAVPTVAPERDLSHLSAEDREALQASAPGHTPGAFARTPRHVDDGVAVRRTKPPEQGARRSRDR